MGENCHGSIPRPEKCVVMTARIMSKYTGGLHIFMAGNRWKMMLIQASKFPLGPMKMWEKLVPLLSGTSFSHIRIG